MTSTPDLPEGTSLLAQGGVRALGALCDVLRARGIDAALVRPPKHGQSG